MVAAPKRPARRKPGVQYNEQELSELSDDSQDTGGSPPPRKKARGKLGAGGPKAKKKGKAKQPAKLLEMPLDVMFEVSGSLYVGFVGFMVCRSSAASNRGICCNCRGRPRPFEESS